MTKNVLILLLLVLVSCTEQPRVERESYVIDGVKVVEIDSCEYIVNEENFGHAYTTSSYESYTHKGNCKFCIERLKQYLNRIKEE